MFSSVLFFSIGSYKNQICLQEPSDFVSTKVLLFISYSFFVRYDEVKANIYTGETGKR